jgi:acyl-CoA reductase-like NAD-dependent aldehyde dehydrogenase
VVPKPYKLYIGGAFPRSESGRYEAILDRDGRHLANASRASRKDFRDAVRAARGAQEEWARRSAYNRAQILYRVAELLEGRRAQFEQELERQGQDAAQAAAEVASAIDGWVYYAGWADKVQQVFSTVNPVASSHFNFSILEPTGVVGIIAPRDRGLLGASAALGAALAIGNTAVLLATEGYRLSAVTLSEVLHASDVPAGVANVLTGRVDELLPHYGSHLDVNAVVYYGDDAAEIERLQREAVANVKRVVLRRGDAWREVEAVGPYAILDTCEVKTTWHPIGQ